MLKTSYSTEDFFAFCMSVSCALGIRFNPEQRKVLQIHKKKTVQTCFWNHSIWQALNDEACCSPLLAAGMFVPCRQHQILLWMWGAVWPLWATLQCVLSACMTEPGKTVSVGGPVGAGCLEDLSSQAFSFLNKNPLSKLAHSYQGAWALWWVESCYEGTPPSKISSLLQLASWQSQLFQQNK